MLKITPVFLVLLVATACVAAAEKAADDNVLLSTRSLWRWRVTWGTDMARLKSGELIPVHPGATSERVTKIVNGRKKFFHQLRKHESHMAWPLPSKNWAAADFADGSWAMLRGPFCHGPAGSGKRGYRSMPLMCMRGKFQVTDPDASGGLQLAMRFQGGAIVYLNGKEIGRAHMPKSKVTLTTPAEDYPNEVFFDEKGLMWDRPSSRGNWRAFDKKLAEGNVWTGAPLCDNPKAATAFVKRLRRLNIKIPSSALRKGTNVLAVELHRAPAPEKFFSAKTRKLSSGHARTFCWWSRIGLQHLKLTAAKAGGAIPNAGHAGRPKGLQVYTHPIYQQVSAKDYTDPSEPLRPIRICGPRNGVHSGQIVLYCDGAIKGLKVAASDLTGPGKIPATAVQIRYGLPDGRSRRESAVIFKGLEEVPVTEVPVYKWDRDGDTGGAAVQPVWVTVRVPRDAKPGSYKGTVTVSVAGNNPVQVPLELKVVDWNMPDSKDFWAFIGLIQSPESVALRYDVPLWSDEHFEKLEHSFKILGEVGAKSIWITAQRRTHFGNEHAMITFEKRGSKLVPDFSVAERYVALAVKHMGKVPVVGLYCWRCPWSTGHFGSHKPEDHKILISVVDPDTGEPREEEGPEWGTPECVELWKPVFEGMKKILAKHGIPKSSLMIGTAGDYFPSDTACRSLAAASGGAKWIMHAHIIRTGFGSGGKHATGYSADGWGGHCRIADPEVGPGPYTAARGFGWKNNSGLIRVKGRGFAGNTTGQRMTVEMLVTSPVSRKSDKERRDYGLHGQGRLGADFWPVLKDKRGRLHSLAARYPETAWGQMSLRCCGMTSLSPGKNGAVSTVRIEMLRENVQEIEARIFIEKILANPAKKAKLGDELAKRAQEVLDERKRLCNRSLRYREALASGIAELSEKLYELAAEVAGKLKTQ